MSTDLRDEEPVITPRPPSEPKAVDFAALLPQPAWRTCSACGAQCLKVCAVCEARAQEATARARRVAEGNATIPPEYDARLEAPGDLTEHARAYVETVGLDALLAYRRLVVLGPAGFGKTRLLAALLRAWNERRGLGGRFVSAYRLGLVRIQHRAGDGDAQLVDEAMGAPLLVLDDLGQERMTATNALPDVIQHRHEQGLPTWVTLGWLDVASAMNGVAALYKSDGIARRVIEGAKVLELHVPPSAPSAPASTPYDAAMRRAGGE